MLLLAVAGATYAYLMRPNALVVAVAPSGGTEPDLLRAYADALAAIAAATGLTRQTVYRIRDNAAEAEAALARWA